jgi:hypothetical protein
MDFATTQSDAQALITQMQQPGVCDSDGGNDCQFNYKLLDYSPRTPTYEVRMDAVAFILPSMGNNQITATGVNPAYAPAKTEVSVCADIPSPVPGVFGFSPAPYRVVARAAATAVMKEQDWFQPGELVNPFDSGLSNGQEFYQPEEYPSGSTASDTGGTGGYDWYAVQYGGNAATAYPVQDGYSFDVYSDDFTKFVGWWAAVPIRPYSGSWSTLALGCAS